MADDLTDFHMITADHPRMQELGLDVFTTGSLYQWLNVKNNVGQFVNRKLIGPGSSANPDPLYEYADSILGHHPQLFSIPPTGNYFFTAFRKGGRNGKYYKYYFNNPNPSLLNVEWQYQQGDVAYTASNIASYPIKSQHTMVDNGGGNYSINSVTASPNLLDEGKICDLIEMNNFVVLKSKIEPNRQNWTPNERAWGEFITDIKSSKEGGLTWSGVVQFNMDLAGSTCSVLEWVKYKLYLYDEKTTQNTNKGLTVAGIPFIVDTKKDALNGRFQEKQNGEVILPPVNESPKNKTAAQLSLTYSEGDGKWESGTQSIVAYIIGDLEAAEDPNVDFLNSTNAQFLDSNTGKGVKIGSGLPLVMQDANPLLWSPEYAEPKGCRKTETKKLVKVYNISPKSFLDREMVLLNKINGYWIPMSLGSGKKISETEPIFEGRWEFNYLMSNADYYFRFNNGGSVYHWDKFQEAIHRSYYTNTVGEDNANNVNTYQAGLNLSLPPVQDSLKGFFQVTSWDFMGPKIGGLRAKNALSCTQFGFDPLGKPLGENEDGKHIHSFTSAPFFGCVFPDGYDTANKYALYRDTNRDINLFAYDVGTIPGVSSPFIRQIDISTNPVKQDVFHNENILTFSPLSDGGVKQGMFEAGDNSVKHLPADIALNASPDGKYGRPIVNLGHIIHTFNGTINTNSVVGFFTDTPTSIGAYRWMYQSKKDSNNIETLGSGVSAFDFKPKTPNKIQFRPLKAEVYASYEQPFIVNNTSKFGQFGNYATNTMKLPAPIGDADPLISVLAWDRNVFYSSLPGPVTILGVTGPIIPSVLGSVGLKYNYAVVNNNIPSNNAKYPQHFWDEPYMNNEPAGAVGIITAVCTVQANSNINFNVDSFIGMDSWIINNRWYPSWGTASDYRNFNTTALYARVYQAHPRNLTVYDPRTWAVFHFNDGVKIQNDPVRKELFNSGIQVVPPTIPVGATTSYPHHFYYIDVQDSTVDFRVPTNYDGSQTAIDTLVYRDSQIREKAHCNIDKKRRGKLLPYKYKKISIGIDSSIHLPVITTTNANLNGGILITNGGTGYNTGDTFTTRGGSGSGVLLRAVAINNGRIASFIVDNPGMDFLPKDFLTQNKPGVIPPTPTQVNTSTVSSISIVPVQVAGNGFVGYIARGKVIETPLLTDEKPKIATSEEKIQLTPNPGVIEPNSQGYTDTMVNSYEKISTLITNKSNDNKYDIFFHFHNDISHTFADIGWGLSPQSREQAVTLEIIPL